MIGCEVTIMIDPKIGERIRYTRELKRYTREDLAEYADISPKFLYEVESGQKGMSATSLLRICNALEVSCDYIMTGTSEKICNEEIINIIETFDATQIANVKKVLIALSELCKF